MATHSIRSEVQAEVLVGVRSEAAKVNVRERVTQAFTEWHVDLYRFALSMGIGPPEAQEVTQDAFLRFYVALDRGESIENQKAWLFRVTHNLAINVGVKERWIGPWTADLEDRERYVKPIL